MQSAYSYILHVPSPYFSTAIFPSRIFQLAFFFSAIPTTTTMATTTTSRMRVAVKPSGLPSVTQRKRKSESRSRVENYGGVSKLLPPSDWLTRPFEGNTFLATLRGSALAHCHFNFNPPGKRRNEKRGGRMNHQKRRLLWATSSSRRTT